MSGHSKWNSIKHKKAATDAKRGKSFTKVIKEISIAAKEGGGNTDNNPRLRTAIQNAKAVNMPSSNIEKAIKKGTGELPGITYEESHYEGYGPGGVAIYVEVSTDNKNRTTAEIRHLFSKHNGNLGETGCVAWMFTKQGSILVDAEGKSEDEVMAIAIEAGAEDIENNGDDSYLVKTEIGNLEDVRSCLEQNGLKVSSAEIVMEPSTTVTLEGKEAGQCLKLMTLIEDHDDVQKVSANFDIPDEILEKLEV